MKYKRKEADITDFTMLSETLYARIKMPIF